MMREGKSKAEMARVLGRHRASIGREIKRNQNKDKSYHPWRATTLYIVRRKKCKRKYRLADEKTHGFVVSCLKQFWSPETIAERWKKTHPEEKLSHSTIYRSLKDGLLQGYSPKTHLRRRGKRKPTHRQQAIKPVHTIHDRPEIVNTRSRLGDMEGDTVSGAIGKGCVVTAIDRKSRMLYAALSPSRDSNLILDAFDKAFHNVNVETLTLDNGSEFAKFPEIEKRHNTTVYFADPHSPWQRPSNENINDVLRFFYPKGTDFTTVQEEDFKNVVDLINNRPRKCLGWLSPIEFISSKCCT
jgi:IS30 family transposase